MWKGLYFKLQTFIVLQNLARSSAHFLQKNSFLQCCSYENTVIGSSNQICDENYTFNSKTFPIIIYKTSFMGKTHIYNQFSFSIDFLWKQSDL